VVLLPLRILGVEDHPNDLFACVIGATREGVLQLAVSNGIRLFGSADSVPYGLKDAFRILNFKPKSDCHLGVPHCHPHPRRRQVFEELVVAGEAECTASGEHGVLRCVLHPQRPAFFHPGTSEETWKVRSSRHKRAGMHDLSRENARALAPAR
jgi:hypothetical protein